MRQTKIKITESYKDTQKENTIVCKGKLVLIEGNVSSSYTRELGLKQPIIISETEGWEEGEFVLHNNHEITNEVFCSDEEDKKWNKKILALPENFSPKQLQAIVDGKLKDGDEVFVECQGTDIFWIEGMEAEIKFNKDNHIKLLKSEKPDGFSKAEQEAIRRFQNGEVWKISTFIDEDTVTAGYGKSDSLGDFEFPLPSVYIKHIYGSTSWDKVTKASDEKRILSNTFKGDFISKEDIKKELMAAYWHGDMMCLEKKTSMEEFDEWFKNKYPNI